LFRFSATAAVKGDVVWRFALLAVIHQPIPVGKDNGWLDTP
jgi:hypothetical protein